MLSKVKILTFILTLLCLACFGVPTFLAQLERDWTIKPSAVGDIKLGSPLPLFVLGMNPQFSSGYYADGIPFVGFTIPSQQLNIKLDKWLIVQAIIPGPLARTGKGTGVGSTLQQLQKAHQSIDSHPIPEPYRCVATTPELPDVYFEFTDCDAAHSGEGVARVHLWQRLSNN